jgi:hypothetical protein
MVSTPITARVTRGSRISSMQVTHIYATKPLKKGQLDRSKIISLAVRSLAFALPHKIITSYYEINAATRNSTCFAHAGGIQY